MEPEDKANKGFDEEQQSLLDHVVYLWELARQQDAEQVRKLLHPYYSGWVTGLDKPHDYETAVRSIGPGTPRLLRYHLKPLQVTVFDHEVGVVHYCYEAQVEGRDGGEELVRGRWSEIYMRRDGAWIMISVSGGPDGQR